MGLLDLVTDGKNRKADQALSDALSEIGSVQSPNIQQLTLPQLQQYVNAGLMDPAEAQAYLQATNAFNTENVPQTGTQAQIEALNQLSGVADAGANGTPVEQAQIAQAIQQMNQSVAGQRGAIEQDAEARGIPAALVQAALANQSVGQDAQQANQNSLQAQSQAYQTALQAMSGKGQLAGQLQGQQNTQANTMAAAQNAMQQFNAQNQQAVSQSNAANRQQANAYNAQNAQNVSNENTQQNNQRTTYNAELPQQVFENQMQKANAMAGVNAQQANQSTKEGQQSAGLFSGLLGAGATLGGNYLIGQGIGNAMAAGGTGGSGAMFSGNPALNLFQPNNIGGMGYADGGIVGSHDYCYHDGGICMDGGGMVPGEARTSGDSAINDTVHIMASPGEAVIPRTVVQEHMPQVLSLLAAGREPTPSAHPDDVKTLLHAMTEIRNHPTLSATTRG